MRAGGSAARNQSLATRAKVPELRLPVQTLPISNGSLGPEFWNIKTQTNASRAGRGQFIEPLGDFLPHPPFRQKGCRVPPSPNQPLSRYGIGWPAFGPQIHRAVSIKWDSGGCPTRFRLSAPVPKQSWLPFHLHYRWYVVKGVLRGFICFRGSALDFLSLQEPRVLSLQVFNVSAI